MAAVENRRLEAHPAVKKKGTLTFEKKVNVPFFQ